MRSPLAIGQAVALFRGAPFRWWIAGGHALELHLGRSWRDHEDTDVGVCRTDHALVREWLHGWHIAMATGGKLTPWSGGPLVEQLHHNNLWCRRDANGPWELDIVVGSGDAAEWIYRRDSSIRRTWDRAILRSQEEVPYLAPELQLLFKSASSRPKDDVDAVEVIPMLTAEQRSFLSDVLDDAHPWQAILEEADRTA